MLVKFQVAFVRAVLVSLGLALAAPCLHAATEEQSMEELKNTVINLLQALVEQGVISREKAEQMVKQAQAKASADAAAIAKSEAGAVRVPYVPQIVKDEISKQVAESVKPGVVADVIKEAKHEGWGVPGAMPEWLSRTRLSGTITVREEALLYGRDNVPYAYLNYNLVNAAGGTGKATAANGLNAYYDTSVDRYRFRGSARIALDSNFTDSISGGVRLSTGNSSDLVSPTQTLDGTAPYTVGIDNLFVRLDERTADKFPYLSVVGGRFLSPWFSPTDLIFHKQLTFNGLAETTRLGFGGRGPDQSHVFMTLAAMPLQEVALSSRDKWLYAGQLGANLYFGDGQRLRFAGAFYDFMNVEGRRNPFASTIYNYTAPQFFRIGNSVFDIANTNDPTVNLYALSPKFRLINAAASYDIPVGRYTFELTGDAVRNVGFNQQEILARTGQLLPVRNKGYQGEISFGTPTVLDWGSWRGLVGYRYLQDNAVIDSLTDSDFHYFGGTDARGYYIVADWGIAHRVWMRFRYLSANSIDGPTFNVDTVQLDVNTIF
jgi:hypothetical protein